MSDLSWRDAIQRVLDGKTEPLHYTEIAEIIVSEGLRTEVGATPPASVNAEISTSIKRFGTESPYERVSQGMYRLKVQGEPTATSGNQTRIEPQDIQEEETGLINAFGMYWDREKVLWESPKLLGCQQIGSTPVDFATQHGVYLLHDRRETVYVGRTTDQSFGVRIKAHTQNRLNGRWDRFSWFGVYPVLDTGVIDAAAKPHFSIQNLITTMEALLIEGLEPRQNRKRGDSFNAVEYLQVEDPAIDQRRKQQLMLQLAQKMGS